MLRSICSINVGRILIGRRTTHQRKSLFSTSPSLGIKQSFELHHSNQLVTPSSSSDAASDLKEFLSVFPSALSQMTCAVKRFDETRTPDAANWFEETLQYNAAKGKRIRGLLTVNTYKLLRPQSTQSEFQLAQYLGWCMEIMHVLVLMADDFFDHSLTRHGHPCWYRVVGLSAANDVLLIRHGVHMLMRKHFKQHPNYVNLLDLFQEIMLVTAIGELLDLHACDQDVTGFTASQYATIVYNKTSFYSFYMPVAAAIHLAGGTDDAKLLAVKEILYEVGLLFQVQDDYLDCFGNPEKIGKVGTDIEDNKCTWLAMEYMKRANDGEKAKLYQHYGISVKIDVEIVKSLYEQMGIKHLYVEFEKQMQSKIELQIQKLSCDILKTVCYQILNGILRRNY